ncbi:bromodomain-containing protein 8 isoform X2 [Periophthalmus magnuspinnatus]|uniref:bromodomain-containing protein 8 isoform X2 n=1 Tax=Periophthalmus magnuspinnatus TaxID=409849 RepID=UPI00145C1797|nr:bromodomain-containing protein 8 isoform X2 [Periophthalmus magnuspinnatus]
MASGVGKHKLLVIGPTEPWSVREKLCLATSVMKSGDQNWVSVSRAIKPFAEPGRPPDWFSQKHCASKYSELLETTEAPKRKRGEKGEIVETVEDVIVRRLTAERIDELKKLIKETQEKHRKLKREAVLIQAGHLDLKLEDLWEDIQQKKKEEEEAAELKRKATDTAYQARLALKLAPKRISGVTINSPTGCGSPNQELSPGDPLECLTSELASPKSALGSAQLISLGCSGSGADEGCHPSVLDESQKKLLVQKATPPPSPLLSELLKKGSILPTNARLIGDGELSAIHMVDSGTPPGLPLPQVPGAPMLSRLLEAGPTPFSAPLGFMVSGDSAASAASPVTEDTDASACTGQNAMPSMGSGCRRATPEVKESELSEEDVNVAYMGDELDLKTVGDIIAIIEDKADESAEALDAAAVEAALSLCEESGHTLAAAWASGPFQPQDSGPTAPPTVTPGASQCSSHQSSTVAKTELLLANRGPSAEHASLCNSQDNCPRALPRGLKGLPQTSLSPCNSSHSEAERKPADDMLQVNQISTKITIKCEGEKWTQHRLDKGHGDSLLEDSPLTERSLKGKKVKDEACFDTAQADCESTGAEDCGVKGEEDEAFLSELEGDMELEPAASESEDGYSLTASSSLQLNTTADSIPSSPASSQFSMCSEDQEALQAHKIWKKAIMLVWRAAANHRYANVFLQPVTDEIAPGYHSIVHRPMDLATIKKNIETGLIRTTAEFQRDIMLMFQNAVMYNSLDHDVYHMALEMQRDVLEQVQQFLATQLIMETSESGISAKSLRGGRESTRRQDSTDKDSVSMSSPAFLLSLFDGGTRGRRCAMEADLKMKK